MDSISIDVDWTNREAGGPREPTLVMARPGAQGGAAIVGGRYRLGRPLGEGGMGVVFEAVDLRTGGARAVKCLRGGGNVDPSIATRFEREAKLLGSVRHPGVVRLLDAGLLPDGGIFFVMDRLSGETLHARLVRERTLAPVVLAAIVDGIAEALEAVHARGLVHRDLKPSNVFVTLDPVTPIRIIDFGIAKVLSGPVLTNPGERVGTPGFMAPEQLLDGRGVDHRADVFALGALVYFALSGRMPFGTGVEALRQTVDGTFVPLRAATPGIDDGVAAVVECALAFEPDRRPPTMRRFADAFRVASTHATAVHAGRAVPSFEPATEVSPPQIFASSAARSSRKPRWLRAFALAGVALALAGAGAGFGGMLFATRHAPRGPIVSTALPEPAPSEPASEAMPPVVRTEPSTVEAEPVPADTRPASEQRPRRRAHRASQMARAERGALARWSD